MGSKGHQQNAFYELPAYGLANFGSKFMGFESSVLKFFTSLWIWFKSLVLKFFLLAFGFTKGGIKKYDPFNSIFSR